MIICNISAVPQMVQLDNPDGTIAEIRVMPKARPTLPPGTTVNQRWLAMNPRTIHIFPDQKPTMLRPPVKTTEPNGSSNGEK